MRFEFIGSGSVPVTSWTDALTSGDSPPFMGPNYALQISTQTGLAGVTIDGLVNGGVSGMTFGLVGSGGNVNSLFIPSSVDRNSVKQATVAGGRTQFAQLRMKSLNGGTTCAIGPSVLNPAPNSEGCYVLVAQLVGRALQLFRNYGSTAAIINAAVGVWADNDTLRIEVDPASAQNTVRCYKNGALQSTDVDNNAARPTGGGMFSVCFFSSNAAGGSLTFDNFSGGLV